MAWVNGRKAIALNHLYVDGKLRIVKKTNLVID